MSHAFNGSHDQNESSIVVVKYDAAVQVSLQTGGLAEGGANFNRLNLFICLFLFIFIYF